MAAMQLLFAIVILVVHQYPIVNTLEITNDASNNVDSAYTQLCHVIRSIKTNYIQVHVEKKSGTYDEFSHQMVRFLNDHCNGAPVQLKWFEMQDSASAYVSNWRHVLLQHVLRKKLLCLLFFDKYFSNYFQNWGAWWYDYVTTIDSDIDIDCDPFKNCYRSGISKLSITIFILNKSTGEYLDAFTAYLKKKPKQVHGEQFYRLMLLLPAKPDDSQWFQSFFNLIWRKKILHVIVVIWKPHKTNAIELWTYRPLNKLDIQLQAVKYTPNLTENDMFFNKIIGLYGEAVTVVMERDPLRAIPDANANGSRYFGIDGELAELMREKYVPNRCSMPGIWMDGGCWTPSGL